MQGGFYSHVLSSQGRGFRRFHHPTHASLIWGRRSATHQTAVSGIYRQAEERSQAARLHPQRFQVVRLHQGKRSYHEAVSSIHDYTGGWVGGSWSVGSQWHCLPIRHPAHRVARFRSG